MPETTDTRVAVYIDFDNIIISRYNQLHGPQQFSRDSVRNFSASHPKADATTAERIERATVDISAILDYASSFGTIAVSRAYADWSALANARYQTQLIERAVDLTQLFPTAGRTKNGADIRLAVDAVEDMFRLADIIHVIIVAGDSDYIALAQRAKRLGRYVVGIGVTGSTSGSLAAACDEFADYDALLQAKSDAEWLYSAEVKAQMRRMDPSFQEVALGFRGFTEFVNSLPSVAELDETSPPNARRLRVLDQTR